MHKITFSGRKIVHLTINVPQSFEIELMKLEIQAPGKLFHYYITCTNYEVQREAIKV